MRRREFIKLLGSVAVITGLLLAHAQPAERTRIIGILSSGSEGDSNFQVRLATFREGMEQAGWIEGRNLRIELRSILADVARVRAHAEALIALPPDVIGTTSNLATATVSQLTRTIPVVFASGGDPVGTGLVKSMARPGANVTGFANYELSIAGKWLELLKEVVPGVRRAAVLHSEGSGSLGLLRTVVELAPSLGIQPTAIPARDASEIDRAQAAFAKPNGAMIVLTGPQIYAHRERIVVAAGRHRLPAVYAVPYNVLSGGPMSYAPDVSDQYRRAAGYVDRILRGESPGDLPVQAPTKYRLFVNLKTARALGLTIPESFLLRADEVIEMRWRDFTVLVGGAVLTASITSVPAGHAEAYRQAGAHVGRILDGGRPADVPVRRLARLEFVINSKGAVAIGPKMPPALLVIADEVLA